MVEAFVIRTDAARAVHARPRVLEPFASFLDDPAVTDIFINGSDGLFVDRGAGTERIASWSATEREVRELAVALMAAGDRHIDDAHPCVDVRLEGGIRAHAVLAPVAVNGTTISLRISRLAKRDLAALQGAGMLTVAHDTWLREAVRRRANFLITGAAGSGKTTLLAALLAEAPAHERIVTIEDVAELQIDHPHCVALETRQATVEGAGEVELARLVREALRMRPDRLVIGECRGDEIRDLLSALNTGHDGGAATVHANSMADVPARIEALGALAGLDAATLARQVVSAIDFVVHVARARDGARRVAGVGACEIDNDRLIVKSIDVASEIAAVTIVRGQQHAA